VKIIDKLFEKIFFKIFSKIKNGSVTITNYDGEVYFIKGELPGVDADIEILDRSFFRNLIIKGDVGFGEDYIDEKWNTSDLEKLIFFALDNVEDTEDAFHGAFIKRMLYVLGHLFKENTKKGSRRNIRSHYDVGNEFYKLWLDDSMTYSSGIFSGENHISLEEAQKNKYDRILSKISKDNPASILEIGCGWGGFAEAAASSNHKIKAITISDAQYNFAKDRLGKFDETGNVNLVKKDYRDVTGTFDYIVSIEMFEAVGQRYWKKYFSKIKETLKNEGTAIIQAITIADEEFDSYRKRTDFIRKHTFPGGMLASVAVMKAEAAKAGLICNEIFSFGQDYAITLREWLNRFDTNKSKIMDMGYSESFIRSWRFYLAYCIAGFRSGRTNVVQLEFAHAEKN
jgi:cyclopropane-fatty-acyl-phospholipid synthase